MGHTKGKSFLPAALPVEGSNSNTGKVTKLVLHVCSGGCFCDLSVKY